MHQKTIHFKNSYLSSREGASDLRITIEEEICKGNKILFDFSKVESVSHSFCDELFAILVLKIGEQKFSEQVSFITNKRDLIESVSIAIEERISE